MEFWYLLRFDSIFEFLEIEISVHYEPSRGGIANGSVNGRCGVSVARASEARGRLIVPRTHRSLQECRCAKLQKEAQVST